MKTLTPDEIDALTVYRQPSRQLKELHDLGYWRARLGRRGIILETAHYEAVCAGALPPGSVPPDSKRPRVRIGK